MDEDLTLWGILGVESSSRKPAQGGPSRLANRDLSKNLVVYARKKSRNFPLAAGVLLHIFFVEPGGPRVVKYLKSQDKRDYPQYCLASASKFEMKSFEELQGAGDLKGKRSRNDGTLFKNTPEKEQGSVALAFKDDQIKHTKCSREVTYGHSKSRQKQKDVTN
jgi:hypothetical protein